MKEHILMQRSVLLLSLCLAHASACQPSGGASGRRLTTSSDPVVPRLNVTQWNTSRMVAVDGRGGIHVVFTQLQTSAIEYPIDRPDPIAVNQLPVGQVRYMRSLDSGASWSEEVEISSREAGVDSPSIVAVGEAVYIIWRGVDSDRLCLFFKRSLNRGASWSLTVSIPDSYPGVSISPPTLAVADQGSAHTAYVVWASGTPQNVSGKRVTTKEIYLRSNPRANQIQGEDAWGAALPVTQPDGFSSWTPSVAAWKNTVHVAWTDERHDTMECTLGGVCREEEYYRRSLDGGMTWEPELRLTTDPEGARAESWAPSLSAWGESVHLAYFDKRTGLFQIYYRRSLDGGATWGADMLLSSGQGPLAAVRPSLMAAANDVHVAWFEYQDFPADIYYRRSQDAGASWGAPYNLTNGFPNAARIPSAAAAPDGRAHVVWYDTRHSDASGPRTEIYYAGAGE